jgi:hypothetical protein
VIAATPVDLRSVSLVDLKEPLKLRHRRWLSVAAVRGDLRRAQEIDRPDCQPRPHAAAVTSRRLAAPLDSHPL